MTAFAARTSMMALRIQKERMTDASIPDPDAFCREWGITAKNLALAAPDAVVHASRAR